MIARWWQAWRRRADERVLSQRAIPDPLWALTLVRFPFLSKRSAADVQRLRALSTLFLARKEFSCPGESPVTDAMAVAVAAQACLPVLNLGLDWYDSFVGIVIHPDAVQVRREHTDEVGVVHEYEDTLSGEAMEGGPLMLSWRDVADAGESAEWGYNVVIHEFAHVIDMRDGVADGIPPLASRADRTHWAAVMDAEYTAFCAQVDADEATFLDPYGAEAPAEFFAVASEAFFVASEDFKAEHSALYALLAGFYRQDPAAAV